MEMFLLLILTATLLTSLSQCQVRRHVIAMQNPRYDIYWAYNETMKSIQIELIANVTSSWLGIGFSPSGGMKGADIMTCWVDSKGKSMLEDRFGQSADGAPTLDTQQNTILESAFDNGTHTGCKFNRTLNTCDTKQDLILTNELTKLIFGLGELDRKTNDELKYHSKNRGSMSVYLLDPPNLGDAESSVFKSYKTFNITNPPVTIPGNMSTSYMCSIHKGISFDKPLHYVGYVPLITPGNEKRVHHMVIYECDGLSEDEKISMNNFAAKKVIRPCYTADPTTTMLWLKCIRMFQAWAIGSKGFMYPRNVGYPIPLTSEGPKFYRLEVHYDNAEKKEFKDSSGISMLYSDRPRPTNAAIMEIGLTYGPLQMIPPGQKAFMSTGFCSSECTKAALPARGIQLFAGTLHSHLLGSKLRLRQFRNGTELPWIQNDENYDFNYQENRPYRRTRRVLRGDLLILECTLNSTSRNKTTVGGLGTGEEMCMAYVSYYPKTNLSGCMSVLDQQKVSTILGLDIQNQVSLTLWMTIGFDTEKGPKPFNEVIDKRFAPWNATSVQLFAGIANGTAVDHYGLCMGNSRQPIKGTEVSVPVGYPKVSNIYIPPKTGNCSSGL